MAFMNQEKKAKIAAELKEEGIMSDLNRFCMICGAREGEHAGYDNRCPHPERDVPGKPMYLDTKFEPYILKGRKQFPPSNFRQRARLAAEPEDDMERDRR